MHRLIKLLFAATAICSPAVAYDDNTPFSTGNHFVRKCATTEWRLACAAYTVGLYHGSQRDRRTICKPEGADNEQLYNIAIAFIKANPKQSHTAAFSIILASWEDAFPCKPQG
jgi:hypothetical protein